MMTHFIAVKLGQEFVRRKPHVILVDGTGFVDEKREMFTIHPKIRLDVLLTFISVRSQICCVCVRHIMTRMCDDARPDRHVDDGHEEHLEHGLRHASTYMAGTLHFSNVICFDRPEL